MQRHGVNVPALTQPVGPFSHMVMTGTLLFLSGQIAQEPATGNLLQGDVAAQTARIFENIQIALKSVDRDLTHVVRVTVYLTDMSDYATMNAIYSQHFQPPFPARSTIAVKALPLGALVEIECVAV